ncbi:MAG: hypothetical protein R2748_17735 [Bryobacterales bacterium]
MHEVASVERQIDDGLRLDDLAQARGLRLEQQDALGDFDRLGHRAKLELDFELRGLVDFQP